MDSNLEGWTKDFLTELKRVTWDENTNGNNKAYIRHAI